MKRFLELAGRFAHFIESGEPLCDSDASELVALTGSDAVAESDKTELIRLLNPCLHRVDWDRLEWERQLAASGKALEEIDNLWRATIVEKQANEHQREKDHHEFVRRHKESLDYERRIDQWIRRLEVEAGADTKKVDELCKTIGKVRSGFPEVDLPTRLRRQLFGADPNIESADNYDRALCQLLYKIMEGLGADLRSQRQIVTLCGDILDKLFPDDTRECDMSFSLRQEMFLLEDFVAENPKDLPGIAWLAEIKSHEAGDEDEAVRLGEELWELSEDLQAEELDRLLWVFIQSTEHDNADQQHACELVRDWHDEEETLVAAIIRRAFITGKWNSNVATSAFLFQFFRGLAPEVMPAKVWLACPFLMDSDRSDGFHVSLERVLAILAELGDSRMILLAVPFAFVGRLVFGNRTTGRHFGDLCGLLEEQATTDDLQRTAAELITRFRQIVDRWPEEHIEAAERLRLLDCQEHFEDLIDTHDDAGLVDAATIREISGDVEDWKEAERVIRENLGEELWRKLNRNTQEHLRQGQHSYTANQRRPADEANYGNVFNSFANALLSEWNHQVWVFLRSRGCKPAFDMRQTLGCIKAFLTQSYDVVNNMRQLIRSHVDLPKLKGLAAQLDELEDIRNAADHAEKVDREWAQNSYSSLIRGGTLREFLSSVHRV